MFLFNPLSLQNLTPRFPNVRHRLSLLFPRSCLNPSVAISQPPFYFVRTTSVQFVIVFPNPKISSQA